MATSAIGINAIAADSDNEIVYSYADENNNIINITQSDLDAEHWNKEALGDTAPAIYENFPMKMIGYTNDLRCGETTDDDGKIIVNPQIAKYTPIHANEFKDYCNSLPAGNIYRVFTISDNRQYAGFFSKDYGDNIYNLTIETYTESDFYAPSEMSLPSVSISDIQNKASELRISDSSFRLKESYQEKYYSNCTKNIYIF